MNNEEIPNEIPAEPNDRRSDVIAANAAFEDPYAEDFIWNPDVGSVTNTPKPKPTFETDHYAVSPVEEFGHITDPYAEPAVEEPTQFGAGPFPPVPFTPESTDETVRRSGLAYSIGIVFVVSVAFMLLLGWIADWMFGTKPWGLVGGIVLGSIIGFVQVVRISSRIFSTDKNGPAMRPLMSHADEEKDEVL